MTPAQRYYYRNREERLAKDDVILKTELYQAFVADTGLSRSKAVFYEDIAKCNINEKKTNVTRFYTGLVRKIESIAE